MYIYSPDSTPAKISSNIDSNLAFSVEFITVSKACLLLKSAFFNSKKFFVNIIISLVVILHSLFLEFCLLLSFLLSAFWAIYSLLYIRVLITNETVPEKHVILSEFQNYGKDFINILEKVCANSGITVFCRNGEVVQDYNGFDVINLIDEYEKENTDLDRCNVPFEKIKK